MQQYDEILELTLKQCEAIRDGDLETLLSLLARREILLVSLPAQNGTGCQAWRRQIAELDRANETVLLAWRKQAADELASIGRGRTGLGRYRGYSQAEGAFIDRIS